MESIFNYTEDELLEILLKNGFKKYNKDQIVDWIYKKKVYDFDMMSNLSKNLIMFLKENFEIKLLDIVTFEESSDTKKYLLKLEDGNKIECVLMHHDYGESLCVSTEVGCNMGCAFCESGRLKKVRNLTTSEMVLELLTVEKDINNRIDNVVIMGIGEPFDNYDNFEKFISILTNPKMVELGSRKITVSTCGLVPKIYEFADLKTQVNLAISLHASNDELRSKLMPVNRRYKISELMDAIKYYLNKTNRRVTIEYIMLKNVNDSVKDAQELAKLLKGILVYVNIIPYNETENNDFKRSDSVQIKKFYDILINNGINATIRREFGGTVSAACGQLRAKANKEELC